MNPLLVGVLVYIVAQLAVGLAVSRRIRSESDYLIAGRRIGLGLATFSMFATWFGAETCVSAAAKFYTEGMAGGTTDPFGYFVVLMVVGAVIAVPLWRRGVTTMVDLFRQRFSPGTERLAALLMAPASVCWAAAQIRAFGQVLNASSDLGVTVCITVAAGVVVVYTCTGGLMADVVTDLVQGIAIIVGLGILVAVLVWHPAVDLGAAWRGIDPEKFRWIPEGESAWARVELWVMTVCGSVVAQEVMARVLGCRSPGVARRAALWGGGLYLAVGLIPAFLGLVGTQLVPGLEDPEHVLPELSARFLPVVLQIVLVGALVSAILSTVDSTLLAASSLVSHNLVVSIRPSTSDRARLRLARAGVVVFGGIAYGLALGSESIFELVQLTNGFGSSGIFVLLFFGLFTRWGGGWTGLGTLAAAVGTWAYGSFVGGWTAPFLVSLASALAVFLVGSLLEPSGEALRQGQSSGVTKPGLP